MKLRIIERARGRERERMRESRKERASERASEQERERESKVFFLGFLRAFVCMSGCALAL